MSYIRHPRKSDDETSDAVLQLLSGDELARFTAREGEGRIKDGDEYIDLSAPDNGVRCVHGAMQLTTGQALPRYAVSPETWAKIGARFGRRFASRPAK